MKAHLKVIGLMSGTSFDGVDIAYIETNGADFIRTICKGRVFEYDNACKKVVLELLERKDFFSLVRMENEITKLHSCFLSEFLVQNSIKKQDLDLIGFHGQTIFHDPEKFFTCQVGNPWILTRDFQTRVVFDFRRKDMCFGGSGAPLAPMYHKAIFGSLAPRVCVVNLGGVANVTFIENGEIIDASDIIGCNNFLAHWLNRNKFDRNYDQDGLLGLAGTVNHSLVDFFFKKTHYAKLLSCGLSMNSSDFDSNFIQDEKILLQDGVATIEYLIAKVIALKVGAFLKHMSSKLVFCGGGRLNIAIVKFVEDILEKEVCMSDDFDFDGDLIEAQAFAYLAARTVLRKHISEPSITGVSEPVVGGVIFEP